MTRHCFTQILRKQTGDAIAGIRGRKTEKLPVLCADRCASGLLRRFVPENDEVGSIPDRAALENNAPHPVILRNEAIHLAFIR
jgi:hypothetical protein